MNDLHAIPTNVPDELSELHLKQCNYFYSFVSQVNDVLDESFEAMTGTDFFRLEKVLSQNGDNQIVKYSGKIDRNASLNMTIEEFEQKIIELAYSQNEWEIGESSIINLD